MQISIYDIIVSYSIVSVKFSLLLFVLPKKNFYPVAYHSILFFVFGFELSAILGTIRIRVRIRIRVYVILYECILVIVIYFILAQEKLKR